MSIPSTQNLVSNTITNNRNQVSLNKLLILELGREIYRMILEHLVVPESKGVRDKQSKQKPKWRTMSQLRELPMTKAGTIWAIKQSNTDL